MAGLKVDRTINGYRFEWVTEMIVISAERIVKKADNISCELTISTTNPAYKHPHLHQKRFNLTSTTAHRTLLKAMEDKYPRAHTGANWDAILEQLSAKILQYEREGEPVSEPWSSDETHKPSYLLKPLLQQGQVTMIFGEGGVGKSYIAGLISMCVSLPWSDNPYAFKTNGHTASTLLCDYETSRNTVAWRLKALQRGCDLPPVNLFYRRCSLPFAEEADRIKQALSDTGAGLLIIDSVGVACAGDLNAPAVANTFAGILRSLNTIVLLIHHTSKDKTEKGKTPFGSTYFTTNARSVWEVRKVQDVGDSDISVGLFHRKSNNTRLHKPIGLRLKFGVDRTEIAPQDIEENFIEQLSDTAQILEVLKKGKMATQDISERLGMAQNKVRALASRLKGRGKLTG